MPHSQLLLYQRFDHRTCCLLNGKLVARIQDHPYCASYPVGGLADRKLPTSLKNHNYFRYARTSPLRPVTDACMNIQRHCSGQSSDTYHPGYAHSWRWQSNSRQRHPRQCPAHTGIPRPEIIALSGHSCGFHIEYKVVPGTRVPAGVKDVSNTIICPEIFGEYPRVFTRVRRRRDDGKTLVVEPKIAFIQRQFNIF
eukprot:scaffold217_cov377-Prasinococcus_capsulatus_cf.AAC.25